MPRYSDPGRIARETLRIAPHASRYRYVRFRWRLLFGIIDTVGNFLMAIRRLFFRASPTHHLSDTPPRRILLIQLDHLGDAALTTVMLAPLRARWPEAEIDVLATPTTCDLFALCPKIDRVFVCRGSRHRRDGHRAWLFSLLQWALKLRRSRYDLAIDVRGEFPHALLMYLAGIPCRVGWAAGGGGFLLSHSATYVRGRSEIRSRIALLDAIGVPACDRPIPARWQTHPKSAATVRARVTREIVGAGPLVLLHIGAGTGAKQWPMAHWLQLIRILNERGYGRCVLVGSAADTPRAVQIMGAFPPAAITNWVGELSIAELVELLRMADAYIGADSGPAHLAAMVDCPTLVLFSGTNEHRQWQPRGSNVSVIRHAVACSPCHRQQCPLADHPCMHGISPQRVIERLQHMLARSTPRRRCPISMS